MIEDNSKRVKTEEHPDGVINHPGGITEELDDDGSRRFTGPGDGILYILPDGRAVLIPPVEVRKQRIWLLINFARNHMPDRPLIISDVGDFKEEARCLLEALRLAVKGSDATGNMIGAPQFFRELAETILPTPAKEAARNAAAAERDAKESKVLGSIANAAEAKKGPPGFDSIKKRWRAAIGRPSEPAQRLIPIMKDVGFGWLCPSKKST